MRRINGCINCGEEREMAAHGLCFKCYRRVERGAERAENSIGNGWLLTDHKKAFTVVTRILTALSDCPAIEQSDRLKIQMILRPYLDKLADCFAPKEKRKPVNGEQKLAVHSVHSTDCRVWASSRKPGTDYSDGSAEDSTTSGDNRFSTQIHSGEQQ
jgi:hypothetical protein